MCNEELIIPAPPDLRCFTCISSGATKEEALRDCEENQKIETCDVGEVCSSAYVSSAGIASYSLFSKVTIEKKCQRKEICKACGSDYTCEVRHN